MKIIRYLICFISIFFLNTLVAKASDDLIKSNTSTTNNALEEAQVEKTYWKFKFINNALGTNSYEIMLEAGVPFVCEPTINSPDGYTYEIKKTGNYEFVYDRFGKLCIVLIDGDVTFEVVLVPKLKTLTLYDKNTGLSKEIVVEALNKVLLKDDYFLSEGFRIVKFYDSANNEYKPYDLFEMPRDNECSLYVVLRCLGEHTFTGPLYDSNYKMCEKCGYRESLTIDEVFTIIAPRYVYLCNNPSISFVYGSIYTDVQILINDKQLNIEFIKNETGQNIATIKFLDYFTSSIVLKMQGLNKKGTKAVKTVSITYIDDHFVQKGSCVTHSFCNECNKDLGITNSGLHTKRIHHEYLDSTVENEGNISYFECGDCHKRFYDYNMTKEIKDYEFIIPKKLKLTLLGKEVWNLGSKGFKISFDEIKDDYYIIVDNVSFLNQSFYYDDKTNSSITFSDSFINSLSLGEHVIEIVGSTHYGSFSFTIKNEAKKSCNNISIIPVFFSYLFVIILRRRKY